MRIRSVVLACATALAAVSCSGGFLRQYEYEEEMYLALDGSASVYVNSSVAALNALRGTSLDPNPDVRPDREAVRAIFETPVTQVVGRITFSSRHNRQFIHVRVDVSDVRKLGEVAPFSWSTYQLGPEGELLAYKQTVGASAGKAVSEARWNGEEIVAFRMHLPSKVEYHNAGVENFKRGNILVWEQLLNERLKGTPLLMETKVQTESILYRTLWLFGLTGVAVAILFVLVIWWLVRRPVASP